VLLNAGGFFYSNALTSLGLVALNRSTSTTVTAPANIEPGDLLIHYYQTENRSTAAATPPSGFTSLGTFAPASWVIQPNPEGYRFKAIISYKIAVGNEDSSTITAGFSPNSFRTLTENLILVYRGNRPIGSVTGASWSSTTSSRTLSITSTDAPLIAVAVFAADNNVNDATVTYSPEETDLVEGLGDKCLYAAKFMPNENTVSNISLAYSQSGSGSGGSGGGTLDKMILSGYIKVEGV
jgi:hypothetical protein